MLEDSSVQLCRVVPPDRACGLRSEFCRPISKQGNLGKNKEKNHDNLREPAIQVKSTFEAKPSNEENNMIYLKSILTKSATCKHRGRSCGVLVCEKVSGSRDRDLISTRSVPQNLISAHDFKALVLTIIAVVVMFSTQALFAQTGHANVSGVVTDSQGALVAGATVTATNTATGVVTPATTNSV